MDFDASLAKSDADQADVPILNRAKAGDLDAMGSLLDRYRPRALGLARRELGPRLRNRLNASDVVQSAFLEMVARIRGFKGGSPADFVRWMGRIIRNNVRDRRRYFDAQKRAGISVRRVISHVSNLKATDPTPSTLLEASEDLDRVERTMATLPGDYQRVIDLVLVQGVSTQDAALELGRTEIATRILLCRARALLASRAKLGGRETTLRTGPKNR